MPTFLIAFYDIATFSCFFERFLGFGCLDPHPLLLHLLLKQGCTLLINGLIHVKINDRIMIIHIIGSI